ncbi:4-hydroxy-tetrahydrodipicolinate synthase [Streptomyces sp. TRM66268-LWL]|uniref:4-hydroxy-tetrahydrodipicolinate synthase n=1 Tax=Streptomyces polyasparticus TaxID=2767826 RepID=A0ABR7SC49_9ACTN|nr:4-hydroxy-tetrahydrodipicolinate synthase [Streptomyces polyasparticus]MBC9711928.1 4-hydroxy-tetrahydrodipicolinate synthase [Streptomyces polyasparticus]
MTTSATPAPFGRALCAMITPFDASGALDLDGARKLAAHLVAEGCEGLVLSGTTGESPTTSDEEKSALIRAVRESVGDRATIVAGVGTADTRHTVHLAREAEQAGADGLLVVSPYYSRPPQDALEAHFREIADATALPVMLYDIPGRTGTRIEPETMIRLAGHERIVAVKDCAYDVLGSSKVIAATGLAYYAGCEEWILPLYAVGGAGFVSTVANVAPGLLRSVVDAYDAGDTARATAAHQRALPLVERVMADGLPGTVTAKALLNEAGLPAGPVRPPLRPADRERVRGLLAAYAAAVEAPVGG